MYKIRNLKSQQEIKAEIELMSQDSLDYLLALAAKYILKREYEPALDTIDRIILCHNGTSQLLLNRALVLTKLQLLGDAIESLSESLELDENNEGAIKLKQILEERVDKLRKYSMGIYQ